jgi:hypothetical protein
LYGLPGARSGLVKARGRQHRRRTDYDQRRHCQRGAGERKRRPQRMRERFAGTDALEALDRIEALGASPTTVRPPVCSMLAAEPAAAAQPTERRAKASIEADPNAGIRLARLNESALHAAAPSSGAFATTAMPAAAKERLAANSLDRATFPSRLALRTRRGVASNGLSEASFISRLAETRAAVSARAPLRGEPQSR